MTMNTPEVLNLIVDRLREAMPNAEFERVTGPDLEIRFPAAHADVGDLEVSLDTESIIVSLPALGHMHTHFGYTDQVVGELVDNAIEFISDMLNDQYIITTATNDNLLVWASFEHRDPSAAKAGSSLVIPRGMPGRTLRHYVWSGPIQV